MFNLFGNNNSNQKQTLAEFQNSFNTNQKAAIICISVIVATCDRPLNPSEETNIENTASLLNFSLSNPLLQELPQYGSQKLISILNTLNRSQKEWVLIAIYELVHCDGTPVKMEINYSAGIARDLGFSENQYLDLIQKKTQILNRFR
jgi:hypothetical protein